jgi:hypothetical protein
MGELVINGNFSVNTNNWIASNSNLSSVGGGVSGNCLKVENSAANAGNGYQVIPTITGQSYYLQIYHKNGDVGGRIAVDSTIVTFTGDILGVNVSDANWTKRVYTIIALSTTTIIILWNNNTTINKFNLWDSISLRQIGVKNSRGMGMGLTLR